MNVTWFTPYPIQPELAAGAIVECEVEGENAREFIPTPLMLELIDDILARGPIWLVEQLPPTVPVFRLESDARAFLLAVFRWFQTGILEVDGMIQLCELYNGTWHDLSEYGYEIGPFPLS